jgi:hypothetical protein
MRASRIGGPVVLPGIPDGDAYALPAQRRVGAASRSSLCAGWATTIRAPSTSTRRDG